MGTEHIHRLALVAVVVASATFGPVGASAFPDQDAAVDVDFFEKRVRPILVDRCLRCHGEDSPKAGLSLTSRDALVRGGTGGAVVVEGNPDESYLVDVLLYRDEPRMPPDGKLSDSEIEAIKQWVARGLPWPESQPSPSSKAQAAGFSITDEQRAFWSFQPVRDPKPPETRHPSWPRSDLDRFILAGMEAEGLEPAPEADKRTLLRRVTFDLTGLPPTPDEAAAFLADDSSEAYPRVVERLLSSPAYGQRWARHWLDVVRYADSLDTRGSGQPGDILDAWRYRDWVVDALNADLPYNRFVQLQIAGDLIPPLSVDEGSHGYNRAGTIATTMLAIGNWGNGDADKDKILTDIADDQVDVISKAFLGLTVSCARCHDHKFDPISQEDYYGLAGIFFSTHILPKLTPKGAGETIARVPLASPEELAAREEHTRRTAELEKTIVEKRTASARALAVSLKPEAPSYVRAARQFLQSGGTDVQTFAKARGLRAFALRRWVDALGGANARLLDQRTEKVGGVAGIVAWNGGDGTSSATANPFDQPYKILTFTLPPRSVSVHPGPASSAVISWRSPIHGAVRIEGDLSDSDSACGDGFAWTLEHRTAAGADLLASGEVANGQSMSLTEATAANSLDRVEIHAGDRIELIVHRRGEYTCDTTSVVLRLVEIDGPGAWDLAADTLPNFASANPMPDRLGNAEVWSFRDTSRSTTASGRPELTAAQTAWRAALAPGATPDQLDAAATALGAALATDDPSSPFWIDNSAAAESELPSIDRDALASLRAELESLRASTPPPLEYANAAQEGGVPESPHAGTHDVAVHIRGRYDRLGPVVPRRFPVILAGDPAKQPPITSGSGRKELAEWITRPDHPLTARVMVNRIWQHHFTRGLVPTPNNFGKLGEPPTHPDLLDWLASRFVESGWSIKALHRLIVLSATYRQSSLASTDALARDPENRLLCRYPRRRLEAESLRDFLLSVSGTLDPSSGGPAVRDFNIPRRGLYVVTIRSDRATYGALFDQADPTAPVERRVESTVAPQALWLLNSPFARAQAAQLADRLMRDVPGDDPLPRIRHAYHLLFSREPTSLEIELAKSLASEEETGWTSLAHVLLCTNEFFYID